MTDELHLEAPDWRRTCVGQCPGRNREPIDCPVHGIAQYVVKVSTPEDQLALPCDGPMLAQNGPGDMLSWPALQARNAVRQSLCSSSVALGPTSGSKEGLGAPQ